MTMFRNGSLLRKSHKMYAFHFNSLNYNRNVKMYSIQYERKRTESLLLFGGHWPFAILSDHKNSDVQKHKIVGQFVCNHRHAVEITCRWWSRTTFFFHLCVITNDPKYNLLPRDEKKVANGMRMQKRVSFHAEITHLTIRNCFFSGLTVFAWCIIIHFMGSPTTCKQH